MDKEKKINFGCSSSNLEGWINLDNSLRHIIISKIPFLPYFLHKLNVLSKDVYKEHREGSFKRVKYGNAVRRLKFQDSSINYIYVSHLLEHLYPEEAKNFLKECFRILKEQGIVRILVPNLEREAKIYLNSLKKRDVDAAQRFNGLIYAYANKKGRKNGHHWTYDFQSLKSILLLSGFKEKNIKKRSLGEGRCPNIEKLDRHKGSLIIEAEKTNNSIS